MTLANRGKVEVHFGDGTVIDQWQAVSLRDTYTDPLGDLRLETRPTRDKAKEYYSRLQKGELVTVLINGVSQGGFLIQAVQTTIGQHGIGFAVHGHTPLVTPYQASANPDYAIKQQADTPVEQVILDILRPFGFTKIVADSRAHVDAISGRPIGGPKPSLTTSALKIRDAHVHEGETAYDYIKRIVTRLGVQLRMTADSEGTLLIQAPDYDQDPSYTLVDGFGGPRQGDYLIGDIEIEDTNDDQFSECTVRGEPIDAAAQTQTNRPIGRVTSAELFPDRPPYKSSSAAIYKPKFVRDKSSRDHERAVSVAKLELGVPASKAFVISGEVDGWIAQTGRVWTVDTIATVDIAAIGFHEDMWVLERVLVQDTRGGQRTRLKLIPKGALVLGDPPK